MYWNVFEFAKEVIFQPRKALKKTQKVKESAKYIAVLSIVSAILIPLLSWVLPITLTSLSEYSRFLGELTGILFVPLFIILSVVGSLVGAGIIHIFGKLFKLLPKDFSRTYTAVAYAETPNLLFGWIPVVNFFAGIWGLVLEVMALKRQHGISTGKAVLAIVVPLVVIVVIAMIFVGILAYWASGFARTSIPVQ